MLPQEAKSVEEAVDAYRKTLLAGSMSFGHTIYADDEYVVIYGATALTGRKHRMQC